MVRNPGRSATATVSDLVLVRVAGLPVTALEELRSPATWETVRRAVAERARLAQEGRALADHCYVLIGDHAGHPLKPALVALRRDLHNSRPPTGALRRAEVRAALPADLLAEVEQWAARLAEADRTPEDLPAVFTAEQHRARSRLRHHVADDALRFGLVQGSPALSDELDAWLTGPDTAEPDRTVPLKLAKYLTRIVAKTSPYATFTLTGSACWVPHGPAVQPTGRWSWRSAVEPNVWLAQKAARALARHPEAAASLHVRVNPSAVEQDGSLWFTGRDRSGEVHGVTASATLRACLEQVGADGTTVAALRAHLGGGEPAVALVDRLLATGLLDLQLPFADQSHDPLGELLGWVDSWLDGVTIPDSEALRQTLGTLRGAIRRYPDLTEVAGRRARHTQVEASVERLFALPGIQETYAAALPRKNLFHENAVLSDPVLNCNRTRWQPALDDLDLLRRLLAVFRHDTVVALVAAPAFAERYGPGARVPYTVYYRDLLRSMAVGAPERGAAAELRALVRQTAGAEHSTATSTVARVRTLHQLRQRLLELLRSAPEQSPGIAAVDRDALAEQLGSWPSYVMPARSISVYAQQAAGPAADEDVRLVLNGVGPGYGQYRSRLHRMLELTGSPAAERAARVLDGDDELLAENDGCFDSNVNLRSPSVRLTIDLPGVTGARRAADRVPLSALVVAPNRASGRLELRVGDEGPAVRPLHLGTMVSSQLPPAIRLLVELFGDTPNSATGTWWLFADIPDGTRRQVTARPRLDLGRVTLARASWTVPAELVPVRHGHESEAEYLLRLAVWFAEQGIPSRCFVRLVKDDRRRTGAVIADKDLKPMYVDLANWFLVKLLERLVRNRVGQVLFQEALPDLGHAPDLGQAGRRVTEFVLELTEQGVHRD
ncbi:lantibiotic dehydratase [Streptomyces sp. NPDC048442]|uniref:lantibiotic dehydratase n=1 Tax=Streptomyces sp. NPDC048442 TaxID=3154823 RepID=UPI00341358DB